MTKCKICNSRTKIWYNDLFDDRHGYPGRFDVLKCTRCGFAQTDPQIPAKEISKLYEDYYPRRNIKTNNINLKDHIAPNKITTWRKGLYINSHYSIPRKPKYKVLDIGSGVGYSLLELKNLGHEVHGLDPDSTGQKVAKRNSIPFHYGFIEDKPFKDLKFDYITASQVLEHTNDPLRFLKECRKRLQKNGKIIISFPNRDSLTRKLLKKQWLHWHIPYHLNHFNKESIYLLAGKSKLTVDSLKTETPNMWTNLQIRRLLQTPEEGVRDNFWDGGNNPSRSPVSSWMNRINYFLEEYNYFNRVIDYLGEGESFVVTLQKN